MAQTAPSLPIRSDEAAALGIALLGHLALVAVLVLYKPADSAPPAPERMSVTLSEDTALVSTAPNPAADPAADAGPVLGESPPEPAPEPEPEPKPQPQPQPVQKVTPPQPKPRVTPPRPQPVARPTAKPTPPRPQPSARPTPPRAKPPTAPPRARPTPPNPRQTGRPGNTSFDNAFKDGIPPGRPGGKDRRPPAQATGQQRTAWQNSVSARVQGPWQRCPISGLDVENLRVVVPFTLGRDRRVVSFGEPRVTGITAANRTQVEPFKACAIKAIKLGAPYAALPDEYYDQWKSRELTFRKGRAQ